MLESSVEGGFFHFSSALKNRVDKGKLKKNAEWPEDKMGWQV